MEVKFTSDGKKVVVIGSLNSTDKIVQEVFIIDGSEIPSGEHFVVKSLHDAPAISWKEKNLKELETTYEKNRKQYSDSIDSIRKRYRNQCDLFEQKIQHIGAILKNADKNAFETLVNYITGKITHIVINKYSGPEIKTFEEFNELYEGKLRLLSFFGKDEGRFDYAINDYYDRSGSNTSFYPFISYDAAFEKFKELILLSPVNDKIIKEAAKYNIELSADSVQAYINKTIENLNKNIDSYTVQINTWKKMIDDYKK